MYVIEVMYANGEIEIFDNVADYRVICDGKIFKIEQTTSNVFTMIPTNQVIRIGRVRGELPL